MKKKELIKKINDFKFPGEITFYIVSNIKEHLEKEKEFKEKIKNTKFRSPFSVQGYIEYGIGTFYGGGIIEFCKNNNIKIDVYIIENKMPIVESYSFFKNVYARNLALASIITGNKPSKTLLSKLYSKHKIKNNYQEIIDLSKIMLDKFENIEMFSSKTSSINMGM